MVKTKKIVAVFINITTEKFMNQVREVKGFTELGPLFNNDQSRYDEYAKCAVDSFKKWHPDVETVFIDDSNLEEYLKLFKDFKLVNQAITNQLVLSAEIMKYYNADKLIILDVNTITCARLDEMLEDNEHDILVSLNFNRFENTEYWQSPLCTYEYENGYKIQEYINLNAGVTCWNNIKAIQRAVELAVTHTTAFGDQGAINELVSIEKTFTSRILDEPWGSSRVSYNVRSKGVNENNLIFHIAMKTPEQSYIRHWYVKDGKLFTPDHKHIKVWHLAEGLHGRPKEDFDNITQMYKKHLFNADTIKFFEEECACKGFFN